MPPPSSHLPPASCLPICLPTSAIRPCLQEQPLGPNRLPSHHHPVKLCCLHKQQNLALLLSGCVILRTSLDLSDPELLACSMETASASAQAPYRAWHRHRVQLLTRHRTLINTSSSASDNLCELPASSFSSQLTDVKKADSNSTNIRLCFQD